MITSMSRWRTLGFAFLFAVLGLAGLAGRSSGQGHYDRPLVAASSAHQVGVSPDPVVIVDR